MISAKIVINLSIALFVVSVGSSVPSASQSSQRVRLTEGEDVDLSFQFDYEPDVDVQIRIGNRWPFYKSNKIHAVGLSASQIQRYSVHVDEESSEMILVRLSISSVSREDEGTLLCDLLKGGEVVLEHTRRIGVSVDFPPGKATCRQENHHIDNSREFWALMNCYAPAGSDHGIIECYQGHERMPPWARPRQNETTLAQMIWMRKTSPIYCCSSPFDKPKGLCQCNDVRWDPVLQKFNEGTNPCLNSEKASETTIPLENQMKSKSTPVRTKPKEPTESSDLGKPETFHVTYSPNQLIPILFLLVSFMLLMIILQVASVVTSVITIRKIRYHKVIPETTDSERGNGSTVSKTKKDKGTQNPGALRKRQCFANKYNSAPTIIEKD